MFFTKKPPKTAQKERKSTKKV